MTQPPIGSYQDRVGALDVLRGFALLGVLLVNMVDFSSSAYWQGFSPTDWSAADEWIRLAVHFLAETKFYLLFATLFGIGFSIQMQRTQAQSSSFTVFYLRRLAILAVIGLMHATLLWRGDILRLYALLGIILLFVRQVPTRYLSIAAVVLMGISFLIFGSAGEESMSLSAAADAQTAANALYLEGSYADLVSYRLTHPDETLWLIIQLPSVLAMFLLGLIVGRSNILQNLSVYYPQMRRWMLAGAVIGLAGNFVYVSTPNPWIAALGQVFGAPALSLFYACAVLRAAHILRGLAPMGKMALTNYVSQSLISTMIFYGYGLGLYNQVPPTSQLLLVAAIFTVQLLISQWWLQRFQYGPLEWVWRSLTYGKWQPIHR